MIPSLPGRDLTPEELELLVHDLAARREEWDEVVRYDADKRWYECLHRDAHVDVWLISWIEEQDTGWHDHDVSSGAVAVVDGALVEERLVLGGPPHRRELPAGEGTRFDPSHVHRLRLADGSRAGDLRARVLAAAVAPRRLPRRRGGRAAPRVGLVRGGAPAGRVGRAGAAAGPRPLGALVITRTKS